MTLSILFSNQKPGGLWVHFQKKSDYHTYYHRSQTVQLLCISLLWGEMRLRGEALLSHTPQIRTVHSWPSVSPQKTAENPAILYNVVFWWRDCLAPGMQRGLWVKHILISLGESLMKLQGLKKKKEDRETDKKAQAHALWGQHSWLCCLNELLQNLPIKGEPKDQSEVSHFVKQTEHTSVRDRDLWPPAIWSPGIQPHWLNQIPDAGPQLGFLSQRNSDRTHKRRYLSEIVSLLSHFFLYLFLHLSDAMEFWFMFWTISGALNNV